MGHIHSTAIVHPTAEIQSSAEVGPFTVIEEHVSVGEGTYIGPHCQIRAQTRVGRNCRIHAGCILGDIPQDRAYQGQVSGCEIGEDSVLREYVTVHRGTKEGSLTRIGARCLIMAAAHVGHNCIVDEDVTLVNGVLLGGYVHIAAKAVLSGRVAVHQFVRVGRGAMIGVASTLVRDVVPYFMIDGPGWNVGINRVGLKRDDATAEEFADVWGAYRILCRERHSFPEALVRLADCLTTERGLSILDFLHRPSIRGIHLKTRRESNQGSAVEADL
ncbi:MAG: acyl-ACP--UDP-N-acetylglucosamine O-acyltransferase [Planctomycetales bacterium]